MKDAHSNVKKPQLEGGRNKVSASSQSGTLTHDFWISSLGPKPLNKTVSADQKSSYSFQQREWFRFREEILL